ncbi:alginate O-acetyltransferase [Clostridia bacterium]|nr:alginate O-acetyltransferase [Clostridia bacterium]
MLVSIAANFFLGIAIDKNKRKSILIIGVAFNLLLLIYFKYFGMLFGSVFNLPDYITNIALPIGISFYTFQIMSYIIDIYRGDAVAQKNIFKLALYVSLFPPLIAGPIVRYHDIAEQIDERKSEPNNIVAGIRRFIIGLSKKMLIANVVAQMADKIFDGNYSSLPTGMAWLGILCYTLQIYFDFSGYSDMAIGLSKMFGFKLLENFNYPYVSRSIQEFWRRWHISLSTWFRDYLYIPLGGNRKGLTRTVINSIIVFTLCGLWHGASWSFVIWGLYHGIFLTAERLGFKNILSKIPKSLSFIYSTLIVMIGWVFFRVPLISDAWEYLKVMFTWRAGEFTSAELMITPYFIFILCVGIISATPVLNKFKDTKFCRITSYIAIPILLILCMSALANNTYNPFIYYRF